MDQNLSNTAQTELPFDETAVAVGHKNGSDEPSYIRCTVIEPVMKCMCLNKARATECIYMKSVGVHKTKSAAIGKMYHRRLQTFPQNET